MTKLEALKNIAQIIAILWAICVVLILGTLPFWVLWAVVSWSGWWLS